jgi:hypothetical protein
VNSVLKDIILQLLLVKHVLYVQQLLNVLFNQPLVETNMTDNVHSAIVDIILLLDLNKLLVHV